jgi:hypothetical protein
MARKEITPALVEQVECLVAERVALPTISARLGITEYVVEVIANDDRRRDRPSLPQRTVSRRIPNTKPGIDATTIRRIHRMLATGILSHVQIAREAGVSVNTVSDVVTGKRKAVTTKQLNPCRGEQFLPEPIRCGQCGAMVSIMPCRACQARRQKNSV